MPLQVPEASLKKYDGSFEEKPYLGNKGYLPQRKPHATYAAMISHLDDGVGRIAGDGAAEVEAGALRGDVDGAMARLPDEQREVVMLVLVEGYAYREAADILEVPIGTVTSRLARGREALMQYLGEAA